MLQRLLFLTALYVVPFLLASQSRQAEYIEAKRLFKEGNYQEASIAFSVLSEDQYFGNYASFYYGLASLNKGDTTRAIDMWKQLLVKAPGWSNENEVLFWLAYSHLASDKLNAGVRYAERLSRNTNSAYVQKDLYTKFLLSQPLEKILQLYENNDDNRELASVLVAKLMQQPYETRDLTKINTLIQKWEFEQNQIPVEKLPEVMKDRYKIGVMLPFMFDSSNLDYILQNKAVMALYQGMLTGAKELKGKGILLDLEPFDTQRSRQRTDQILNSLPENYLDLVVGPLMAGPFESVQQYSKTNKLNMINPVSSSSGVIGDNPYGFLFKPTVETMAVSLAKQAKLQFKNKNLMIFYENNDRDSVFASVYRSELELDSFRVVWSKVLTADNAKEVLDELIATDDIYYSQEEADSIALIPGRFIKERRVRNDEMERLQKYESGKSKRYSDSVFYYSLPVTINDNNQAITYYETKLRIEKDSIGHVFGATSKNFMANNLISAVETMGDSTVLFGFGGYKDWLDFTMLSFSQLERNGVSMVSPEYVEYWSPEYKSVKAKLISEWKAEPLIYHYIGYELITQIGPLMDEYGKYFQNGLREGDYFKGKVFQGMKYGTANDNQVTPVVRFEDAKLKVVNKDSYED